METPPNSERNLCRRGAAAILSAAWIELDRFCETPTAPNGDTPASSAMDPELQEMASDMEQDALGG